MPELFIFEMDPTGGCCGFPADIPGLPPAEIMRQELVRRNRIANQVKSQLKIDVQRIFLRNASLLENKTVKAFVEKEGMKAFPVFLYGEKIIHCGNFPDFEIIAEKLSKE
ncbi:MAG TPA: arsenic metallochaperone ArsD family protein [Candidatus Deferrimicrobium sp.]|nr:arsenic metallochaperone ArsD family protein [Candidatus Deferrimicrobium sp.]